MTDKLPVDSCGHAHEGPCPDHSWTDACPYQGTDCPPAEERERVTAKLSRDFNWFDLDRPDVPGPMPHWPDGGNWEGGCTDSHGQRWHHAPNEGWAPRGPIRYLVTDGHRNEPVSGLSPANPATHDLPTTTQRRWWQRLWPRRAR